jgi:FG-GAP-like repeat/Ricin-type beta-trefoil lectin domain-like
MKKIFLSMCWMAFAQVVAAQIAEGLYSIQLAATQKGLDAENANRFANNCTVRLWGANARGESQVWRIVKSDSKADNGTVFYKIILASSGKALDAEPSHFFENDCKVRLWDDLHGVNSQLWIIKTLGNNKYQIELAASGKALDADGASMNDNGCIIHLWDKRNDGFKTQTWRIEKTNLIVAQPPPPPTPPSGRPNPNNVRDHRNEGNQNDGQVVNNGNWGGGEDYTRIVTTGNRMVKNKIELLAALKAAVRGDVVYVDDNANIDLSGEKEIVINEGVTLASGRGHNGSLGAFLFCDNLGSYNLFHITAKNTRITGLRLKGPMASEKPAHGEKDVPGCIAIDCGTEVDEENLNFQVPDLQVEIDNNEIWAWPLHGVNVEFVKGVKIAYNEIHHNRYDYDGHGHGYGTSINAGQAIVEKNIFSFNRHDIASGGHPFSSYIFRNNLVLQGGTHHSIDVHGWHEKEQNHLRPDGHCTAGNNFLIDGNIVLEDFNWIKSTFWAYNVLIRGIPKDVVTIRNNKFAQKKDYTIAQCQDGGLDWSNRFWNVFDVLTIVSGIAVENNNAFGVDYPNALFISTSGDSYWNFRHFDPRPFTYDPTLKKEVPKYVMQVGNFNGDKRDDLFYSDGNKWMISYLTKGEFQEGNRSNTPANELRFGDFDGDGKTDVFSTNGKQWRISKGGTNEWMEINSSSIALDKLRFGDFDGDGKTDVFYIDGKQWKVSKGGTTEFSFLNESAASLSDLIFADFNGDKKTDILWVHDGKWQVSWSGQTAWDKINTAGIPVYNLRTGDFDGDGKADLFKTEDGKWFVSYAGRSTWQKINSSPYTVNDLTFGDFNGDGRTDIIVSFNEWR